MNSNSLPVSYPIVSTYPKHAIPFSILSQNQDFLPWFYSNYIQIKCSKTFMKNYPSDAFDFFTIYPEFYENPSLQSERLSNTTILNLQSDIIKFIIDCIDMGYYLYTHVNEYYLPNTHAFKKFNNPHAILIYGYNKTNGSESNFWTQIS